MNRLPALISFVLLSACAISPEQMAANQAERECQHLLNADKEYKQYSECKLRSFGASFPGHQAQAEQNRRDMQDLDAALGAFAEGTREYARNQPRPITCYSRGSSTNSTTTCY